MCCKGMMSLITSQLESKSYKLLVSKQRSQWLISANMQGKQYQWMQNALHASPGLDLTCNTSCQPSYRQKRQNKYT